MTRDDIMRWAQEAYGPDPLPKQDWIHTFAATVAAAEREECANWLRRNANAEKHPEKRAAFIEAHNAIRARGNQKETI